MKAALRPTGRQITKSLISQSRQIQTSSASKEATKEAAAAPKESKKTVASTEPEAEAKKTKKTMAEMDDELRRKLEGISGDGGASGLEYEDGKAVAMKRGVKNNMFRLI